jgi:hypothetical protein
VWWFHRPHTDAKYLEALQQAGLSTTYPNERAAVAHGKDFCRQLAGGREPIGYASEEIAVRFYCRSFLTGFTVVPTPEEQREEYLSALRDGGYGGEFPSDAAAVAHANSICNSLREGGKQQGMPVDLIGVKTYCSEFESGYKVLETIKVQGSFELIDTDPGYYFPSIVSSGGACEGSSGYSDIHSGTSVILKNSTGTLLAQTTLSAGTGDRMFCTFTFSLTVTEGEDDYVASVSHRGDVHYSFQQLKSSGLHLTLGD